MPNDYVIVGEDASEPDGCHIIRVRVHRIGKRRAKARTVMQVRRRMEAGSRFYAPNTYGALLHVEATDCPQCGAPTIGRR